MKHELMRIVSKQLATMTVEVFADALDYFFERILTCHRHMWQKALMVALSHVKHLPHWQDLEMKLQDLTEKAYMKTKKSLEDQNDLFTCACQIDLPKEDIDTILNGTDDSQLEKQLESHVWQVKMQIFDFLEYHVDEVIIPLAFHVQEGIDYRDMMLMADEVMNNHGPQVKQLEKQMKVLQIIQKVATDV